ncbi:MAG: PIN domain-containing protein [Victivallales bacterium]
MTGKIYLDAAPIIDLVKIKVGIDLDEEEGKNVWYTDRILEAARKGDVELYTSILTIAECTHVKDKAKIESAKPFFMGLLASGKSGIRLIQPTLTIVESARDLRWIHKANLSGMDSIHIASALHFKCDEFLTTDRKVLKNSKTISKLNLKLYKPLETILLPSLYLQENLSLKE